MNRLQFSIVILFLFLLISVFSISIFINYPRELNDYGLEISSPTDTINGEYYVDLGLSVKWAYCNFNAEYPYNEGSLVSINELNSIGFTTKSMSISTVSESIINQEITYNGGRVPNIEEVEELLENCTFSFGYLKGTDNPGTRVRGPNGNSIFIPSNSFISDESLSISGLHKLSIIFTSSIESNNIFPKQLLFTDVEQIEASFDTETTFSIRLVLDK